MINSIKHLVRRIILKVLKAVSPMLTIISKALKRQKHAEHAATIASVAAKSGHTRLSGKVAIVTGAATGIGRATALLFAREGAKVILADINETDGRETEKSIITNGGEAVFIRTDVASDPDVARMIQTSVERYGKIDILDNNAGILLEGSVVNMSPENWQRVIEVNLSSVYRCCRHAIPEMIKRGGGAIINISSAQGLTGFVNASGYAASKGGIIALTRQMAVDYGVSGVRINCICPGIILTPIYGQVLERPADREALFDTWADYSPLGHFGLPEDIAYSALYLASDESSFVTGITLVVDGGLTIRGI